MAKPHLHVRRPLAVVVVVLSMVTASCGADDGPSGPTVVVSHSLLGDVVRNVAGHEAAVEVLMPVGADPHEFEPSARQVAELTEADLVVVNGLGFEAELDEALETAESAGADVLSLGEELDPLPFPALSPHEDEHAEGAELDPHWFTDPSRMADAVGLIAEAVAAVEEVDAQVVSAQGEQYAEELRTADAEIQSELAAIPEDQRTLVTNHEVFGYFADRYHFTVIGAVIPTGTTLADPSADDVADLADLLRDEDVPAIFADSSAPTDLADALADEVGQPVDIVPLYSESLGEVGSGAETYLGLIQTNARRISEALN